MRFYLFYVLLPTYFMLSFIGFFFLSVLLFLQVFSGVTLRHSLPSCVLFFYGPRLCFASSFLRVSLQFVNLLCLRLSSFPASSPFVSVFLHLLRPSLSLSSIVSIPDNFFCRLIPFSDLVSLMLSFIY